VVQEVGRRHPLGRFALRVEQSAHEVEVRQPITDAQFHGRAVLLSAKVANVSGFHLGMEHAKRAVGREAAPEAILQGSNPMLWPRATCTSSTFLVKPLHPGDAPG
jgi:hypothetical protein